MCIRDRLYVGMVLMSNGLHRLEGIPDKSNVVMNIFTGGLGLILNIIVIAYGACTGQGAEWFYGSATGLLFAFTYLYSAINTIFDFDQRYEKKIIVATKAFGMGVDISDIDRVYHVAPSSTFVDYIQEIG